jgi:hypothetical protein
MPPTTTHDPAPADAPHPSAPLTAYSPHGHPITGTLERLSGVAQASSVTRDAPDAPIEANYTGWTEVDWDAQESVTDPQRGTRFTCDDGSEWWEDELVWRPADDGEDDELETS